MGVLWTRKTAYSQRFKKKLGRLAMNEELCFFLARMNTYVSAIMTFSHCCERKSMRLWLCTESRKRSFDVLCLAGFAGWNR